MGDPICFGCRHFRQRQPLTFTQPGDCGWQADRPPAWLGIWLDSDDRYYGPKREVWGRGMHALTYCDAFEERPTSPTIDESASEREASHG